MTPWRAVALASVLMLLWSSPEIWLRVRADYLSGSVPLSVTLPDGSRAALDAEAAIGLRFDEDRREVVLLRGAAWFEVKHEARPFQVVAGRGITRDIGTAFSVERLDGAGARVAVEQGVVEVSDPHSGDSHRLRAGQVLSYGVRATPGAAAVNVATVGAWRRGEVLLVDMDARQAIGHMARYRAAPVWVIGHGSAPRVTATFRTDRADEAIAALAERLGLNVRTLPGGALLLL